MSDLALACAPVDRTRWDDLVALFEGRGGPHYCWCMAWRKKPAMKKAADRKTRKAALKAALRARVDDGIPIGILGYRRGVPVAWCSIAPRPSYRPLGGPDAPGKEETIWSLACFFVERAYRGQGVSDQLLAAAIGYARAQGARIVEAYPVDPDSPSYRFMGVVGVFERAGFRKVGAAGARRHVMRLRLSVD